MNALASCVASCSRRTATSNAEGAFVVNEPPPGMPSAMKPVIGLAPQLSCPLLGLFGGLLLGLSRRVDASSALSVELLRPVPSVALIPLVVFTGLASQPVMRRLSAESLSEAMGKQAVLVETIGSLETVKSANAGSMLAERWDKAVMSHAGASLRQRVAGTRPGAEET